MAISKLDAVASPLALLGARALHADALMRAPRFEHAGGGLTEHLDADARVLAAGDRVRPTDHFPLAALVHESVSDPKLHRKDLGEGRCRLTLLLGARPRH